MLTIHWIIKPLSCWKVTLPVLSQMLLTLLIHWSLYWQERFIVLDNIGCKTMFQCLPLTKQKWVLAVACMCVTKMPNEGISCWSVVPPAGVLVTGQLAWQSYVIKLFEWMGHFNFAWIHILPINTVTFESSLACYVFHIIFSKQKPWHLCYFSDIKCALTVSSVSCNSLSTKLCNLLISCYLTNCQDRYKCHLINPLLCQIQ